MNASATISTSSSSTGLPAAVVGAGVTPRRSSRARVARQVVLTDEDVTRLAAVVAGDDAHALHDVDQTSGARIADAQAALQQRHRGGAGAYDGLDRLGEQLVGVGGRRRHLAAFGRSAFEQLFLELGRRLQAPVLGDQLHLLGR